MKSRYHDIYAGWKSDPEGFWADAASEIDWIKPWDKVFDKVDGLDRWFVGAECNTCWNCVDRHVEAGRGEQAAIIYDSPITGAKRTYSYAQLLDEVACFAQVLSDKGAARGDRVIIYMPIVSKSIHI